MIVSLLAGLVMDSLGYYCVLAYCSLSLVVFMVSECTKLTKANFEHCDT